MESDLAAFDFVVTGVGDEEVRLSIKSEGGEVFPIGVLYASKTKESQCLAAGVGEVDRGVGATVIDQPQQLGIAPRNGESAGFCDLGVEKPHGYLRRFRFQRRTRGEAEGEE